MGITIMGQRKKILQRIEQLKQRLKLPKQSIESTSEEQSNNSSQDEFREIFVKNLPKNFNNYRLRKLFGKYGEISFSRILKNNGNPIGCALVNFKNSKDAKNAIEGENGKLVFGQKIFVQKSRKKPLWRTKFVKSNLFIKVLTLFLLV